MDDSASEDSAELNPWDGLDGIGMRRFRPPVLVRCIKHGQQICDDCAQSGRFPFEDSDNESMICEAGARGQSEIWSFHLVSSTTYL